MNLMFDKWIYNKDKVHGIKALCKRNHKDVIIIRFLLHQSIVPKLFWLMLS
jgi:hypothetical protein